MNNDLISREALKEHAQKLLVGESINTYFGINLYKMFEEIIDNTPTVLGKEVVEETEKACKTCDYYVNKYGYGQCYGQKDAPRVDENEVCESWKKGGKEE